MLVRHLILASCLLFCCAACGRIGAPGRVAATLAEVKPEDLLTVDEASKLLGRPVVFLERQSIFPRSRIFRYTTPEGAYTDPVIQLTICPVASQTAFEYFTHRHRRSEMIPCKLSGVGEVCLTDGSNTSVYVLSRNTFIEVQLWHGRNNQPVDGSLGGAEELGKRIVELLPDGEPNSEKPPAS